jgi:hypothetical protein
MRLEEKKNYSLFACRDSKKVGDMKPMGAKFDVLLAAFFLKELNL